MYVGSTIWRLGRAVSWQDALYQKMKNCGESKGRGDEGRKEGVCILCLGHL